MSEVRVIPAGSTADRADGAAAVRGPAATAVIQAWAVPVVAGAELHAAAVTVGVCHAAAVECAAVAGGDVSREVKL